MVATFTLPVLETSADEAVNNQRHNYNLTAEGAKDGTKRVVIFLGGIVKHEHVIGNEVVIDGGKVLFVPKSSQKET